MKRSRTAALLGSALFLIVAPGTVAGLLPWLIGGWRFEDDFGSSPIPGIAGALLILLGLAALLESFVRFALKGLGTPAPIAPTERLIVSGQYRHVRNPMYVAVLSTITGQALWFGQAELLPTQLRPGWRSTCSSSATKSRHSAGGSRMSMSGIVVTCGAGSRGWFHGEDRRIANPESGV